MNTLQVSPWTSSEIVIAVVVGLLVLAVIVKTVINAERETKKA
jgi:hypothetical protein